jgi:hypothetical protein
MMSDTSHNQDGVHLPESLSRQLARFEKRLFLAETLVAVFAAASGLLLTYSLLFALDRFWDTPAGLRVVLMAAGSATAAWLAWWWGRRWWWRRPDSRGLARLVRRTQPKIGERLLGAVELANGTGLPPNVSPSLCRAAVNQVAAEVSRHDLTTAVPSRPVRRWSVPFAILAAAVLASVAAFPQAARNALARWLKPLAPVERYTFTRIEALPDRLVVPHGEDFEIACRLSPFSAWRPPYAVCRFEGQPPIRAEVRGGGAIFKIPGQTREGILTLRVGDVAKPIAVVPALRPELVRLRAELTLPEYLARPPQTVEVRNPSVELLRGSQVRFRAEVSRELKAASLETAFQAKAGEPPAKPARIEVPVAGRAFATAPLDVDRLDSCSFVWTDAIGLSGPAPRVLKVEPVDDATPGVEFSGIAPAIAMLEDEVVEGQVRAEDDYGLRELWVAWASDPGKSGTAPAVQGSQVIRRGSPQTLELSGKFSFCPAVQHVPEETLVTLCASASDYFPGRKPGLSPVRRIYVLSRARHAKLLQEQMQVLQARLEDLIRQEEALRERNEDVRKLSPQELAAEKSGRKLSENAQTERRNQEDLDRIASGVDELTREALRNRDIPEEVLRQWSEMAGAMKKTAAEKMNEAARSLRQAGGEAQQRSEKLDRALALEQQILEALRKMERGMNSAMEDMAAKSFVNRLKAAATQEREIGKALGGLLPSLIGLDPAAIPAETANQVKGLAGRQDTTGVSVKHVQDDLGGFHHRTRLAVYGEVHKDMQEKQAVARLGALAGSIRENLGVKAIEETQSWEKQLLVWAEKLEGARKGDRSGEGQGQGEGEPDPQLIELIMALMRARQAEESLREQTRLLEDGRSANAAYEADSVKLSQKQYDLASDVRPLERRAKDPEVRRLVEKVNGEMMNAGMFLRKPQTDAATVAIETEIIELLSDSISQSASQGGAQAMAMAMAMGGMKRGRGAGAGRTGGGSTAGGTTDRPNLPVSGNTTGEGDGARPVDKTGGMDVSSWPEEFRDALESYFRGLEEGR